MRFWSNLPFFLSSLSGGGGSVAPQLKSFDVFYTDPVVVGVQVTNVLYDAAPVVGFYAFADPAVDNGGNPCDC